LARNAAAAALAFVNQGVSEDCYEHGSGRGKNGQRIPANRGKIANSCPTKPAFGDTPLDDSHEVKHVANLINMKMIGVRAEVKWIEMQRRHPGCSG